jgi:CBS domain-containing protein
MSTVANILKRKNNKLYICSPEMMVVDALQMMDDKNIGSLVVLHNNHYQGIITERDYARKVVIKGKRSFDTRVSDIMSTNLPRVTANDTVEHCMALMSDHNVRYLPVMEGTTLKGIVSVLDLVSETISHQKETISHLRDFIHGGSYA